MGRRPMGRRGRNGEATREALLTAATRLFAEQGFDGVTVDAVAREAKVNKAMISYHFGGKQKLYQAILTSTFSEIVGRLERVRHAPRPAPDLLREFVAIFAEMAMVRRPNFPALLLREVLSGRRRLDPEIPRHVLAVFSALREIVERGVSEGTFRPVDPLLTHLSVIGSLAFFFATSPFRDRLVAEGRIPLAAPDPAEYVRHIQDLMTRGLAAASVATTEPEAL